MTTDAERLATVEATTNAIMKTLDTHVGREDKMWKKVGNNSESIASLITLNKVILGVGISLALSMVGLVLNMVFGK